MKRLLFVAAMVVAITTVIAGTIFASLSYLSSNNTNKPTACTRGPHHWTVLIDHDHLSSDAITARQCDTLTITNGDDQLRLMAFGPHDDHQAYDGIAQQTLTKGQSLTVALNQTGTFTFHDHLHDELIGVFTVVQ